MGLYEKLVNGEEKLSLVGLGYVGMPHCGCLRQENQCYRL